MDKLFIQADELLSDSFKLAWKVYESGYRPNYIIGAVSYTHLTLPTKA